MTLKEQRAEALKAALAIVAGAKAARGEDAVLTEDEATKVKEYREQVTEIDKKIVKADEDQELVKSLGALGKTDEPIEAKADEVKTPQAKVDEPAQSLGEHFIKSGAHGRLVKAKTEANRISVAAPEYVEQKAPTPGALTVGRGNLNGLQPLPAIGPFVTSVLNRPTVADLLGTGNLGNSTSLKYFVQDELPASASGASGAGGFATVGEGGLKPQLNFAAHAMVENLYKIAGWYQVSDEMLEDEAYFISIINGQLLQRLALAEELKLLLGNGSNDIDGLLHRTAITGNANAISVSASAASGANSTAVADAVFQAIVNIQLTSGLAADGVLMNPADYLALRLKKDANGQYYGGGFFTGQYGNGGNPLSPNPWELKVVQTPACPQGKILVADFNDGAQIYRKGGVRVDSTNTDQDDFLYNMVKVRAEERLLLAVPRPSAFSLITVS